MERMPSDLQKALSGKPKASSAWKDLTPIARRDFTTWIESAKQLETRKRRIERTIDMLVSGKRRPCCYAVVPMNLYKALGELPKAKATWKQLTPTERRDFVSFIDEVQGSEARAHRVEKVCALLIAQKRRHQ